MVKKDTKRDYGKMLLHIPNPMHLEACKQGSKIYRNRKVYNRKEKYKKNHSEYER